MKKQRSVRSMKSLLGSTTDFDSSELASSASSAVFARSAGGGGGVGGPSKVLRALHLPASLCNGDSLSPGLWAYVQSSSHANAVDAETLSIAAAYTRIFSANGVQVELPEHLRALPDTVCDDAGGYRGPVGGKALPGMARPGSDRAMSNNGTVNGSIRSNSKISRRPVAGVFATAAAAAGHEVEDQYHSRHRIRRLYLQMNELRLKNSTNAQSVVCRIQIGHQRPCSSVLSLRKEASKGFGLVAQPNEGFVFDMDDTDTRVLIRVHGLPAGYRMSTDHLQHSAHDLLATAAEPHRSKLSLLSGLRRSPTASSLRLDPSGTSTPTTAYTTSSSQYPPPPPPAARVPNSATIEAGPLLGELMFVLPGHLGAGKTTGEYIANSSNGKKEIARVSLVMGAVVDEDYFPEPEADPIPPEPEFGDYLNFLMRTSGASIWRKYWCLLGDNELQIFDFEYREIKPVSRIPLPHITQIHPADPELVCAPHCIELTLSPKHSFADTLPGWTSRVVDSKPSVVVAGGASSLHSHELVAYVTADAADRAVVWMDKIAREKARMAGAGTPVPPRRARKPVAAVA
ncbi:hypothetical protein HDU87_000955 [Geranomyces variabilis]|uniref:PH domain-containing protein n=1 Tax=Geranomyces variabilis TaxID=109894 RepID=A0AAD5TBJ8_9FUNG|nr:hypothetical protein HDU87_000955 [Geranomyces variabilis]